MRTNLRVVHAVESLAVGGMERMIETLCETGAAHGVEHHVLCFRETGLIGEGLKRRGYPVESLELRAGPRSYIASLYAAAVIRRLRPDAVHTHNWSGLVFGAPGARLAGVRRVIHTEHGRAFPDRVHRSLAERLASSCATHIVGVSMETADALHRYSRVARSKLTVIPNGVPDHAWSEGARETVRRELGLTPDELVVGVTARLVWEKGLDRLLRAFAVLRSREAHARLVIAGDGPERASLEALASGEGIPSVRFLGARSDVPNVLRAFDVYALASISEGLPLSLLEAMSAGRAIVGTDVGGIARALDGGRAGIVVQPNDVDALARALIRLAADPDLRRDLGQKARARYLDLFTADAMARAYRRLYDGVSAPPVAT